MKIENLKCLDYQKFQDILMVKIASSETMETIKNGLDGKSALTVYTDNTETLVEVEKIYNYSKVNSIKLNLVDGTFDVEILKSNSLEMKIAELQEQIDFLMGV